jgi:MFS transporter, ACS family, hexuronate transporter
MLNEEKTTYDSYRWVIVGLLFCATMINYFDRLVLSVLIPEIKKSLSMNDIQYSYVLAVFQMSYTLGSLAAGKFIDWAGTRLGYLLSIVFWSFAAAMHATAGSAWGLAGWRGLLGVSESGNFPSAMKAVSEWFPKEERSFATSLFNSGPSVAMITGAPIIAGLTLYMGWRWAFLIMGLTGFVLAIFWPILYKKPKHLTGSPSAAGENKYPWSQLLTHRETYGIMLGKALTDPVWWFYLFWLPSYLNSQRGFDLKGIAIAVPLIYIIAIIIGNFGGWLPGFLMRHGWPVTRARKAVMFLAAACLPVTALAVSAHNVWTAVLLVSLACGAHSIWSHNIFAMVIDQFPHKAVGSVTGLGGFAGSLAGFFISTIAVGYIVTYVGYVPIFILMGVLHPTAYLCVHFLIRRNTPLEI